MSRFQPQHGGPPAPHRRERPEHRADRWLLALDRLVLRLFFRRIEVEGAERAADLGEGPVIVVANHVNSLIDPMLVLAYSPRVPRFLGKSTLWEMAFLRPFLDWAQVIPVYRRQDPGVDTSRNTETFAASRRLLASGGVLALFPEGRSHSEPSLGEIRTGAARMALESEMESGPLGIRILPMGLMFDAKERFRSRVLVELGEPFDALEAAGEMAPEPGTGLGAGDGSDGGAPPEAVRVLTDAIDRALSEVTVGFDTWDEARLVRRAAEIYTRPTLDVPRREGMAESSSALRAFAEGYRELRQRHPEKVARVAEAVRAYDRLLETAGLRDRHVAAAYELPPVARFLRRSLTALLVNLPLALAGTVLNVVPYQLVSWFARRIRRKDADKPDVVATWKVFPGLALYPLFWVLQAVVAGWTVGRGAGLGAGWSVGAVVALLGPLAGWVALLFHDRRSRLLHEIRAFLVLRSRRGFAGELRRERETVRGLVGELVELYGAADG